MSASLRIGLLGDFQLVHGDEPVTSVDTPRLQALVAWLTLHRGTPQSRRRIAFAFWPDSSEKQAFNNLRNLLYVLRRQWPAVDAFLEIETKTLRWTPNVSCRIDVADFDRLLAEANEAIQHADEATARSTLEQAAALYRGELLPGCYDEWILAERERLHQACLRALEQLVRLLESARNYASAVERAERLVRLDPLREASYRTLMRLHALNRDRASALRAYERCAAVLRDEMDLAPEPATEALHRRLLDAPNAAPSAEESAERSPSAPPLVGRHAEWKQLRVTWQHAAAGRAHMTVVTGEAGIGKTRLAEELFAWAERQGIAAARAGCYAAEGRLAYAPVVEWLRADALQSGLDRLAPVWRAEAAHLLPELRTDPPDPANAASADEPMRRARLFEALARAILGVGRPLLLLLDDLQWCDRDTLEWLHFLLRFGPDARLLLLGTARVEEVGPLHPLRSLLLDLGRTQQITEVALRPLDADETAQLASHVARHVLEDADADHLYRETEGNPLFVVETVRAGLPARGAAPSDVPSSATAQLLSPSPHLPATVQAVIRRRLAQLSPAAQAVVSVAAAIGRSFRFEVLARSSFQDEQTLAAALDELWQHRIVRTHGTSAYDFTHDKLREVAYAEISPSHRHLLHRRVAEALEAVHDDDLDAVSTTVAVHYAQGGMPREAIAFYQRGAEVAQQIGSHREAAQLLDRALALVAELPSGRERDRLELDLLMQQGLAFRIAAGHGAPEVRRVFEKARPLSERIGDTRQRFAVQRGLWAFHLIRAEYAAAQSLGDALQMLADRCDDRALRLEAEIALGLTRAWRGELEPAEALLEAARVRYDPAQHRMHAQRFGQDPGVAARSVLAFVQALRGDAPSARRHIDEALAHAEMLGHRFSRAYALQHAALVDVVMGDAAAARAHAETLVAFSRERGFAYWIGPGLILHGWALAATGQPAHGLERIREGLAAHRETGARFQSTLWLGLLTDACHRAEAVDEGLDHIAAALEQARASGEHVWTAELHRLHGTLLVERDARDDAERAFQEALDVARLQQSCSLELRATTDRARLWHRRGRTDQARDCLQAAVDAFPSDGDLSDLQAARDLLEMVAPR